MKTIKLHSLGYADNLPVAEEKVTWKQFKDMVNSHDLTYQYSDDSRWYNAGYKSEQAIMKAAKNFPEKKVAAVWNKMVDKAVVKDVREQFYWRTEN